MTDVYYAISIEDIIHQFDMINQEPALQHQEIIHEYIISEHGDNLKEASKICVYAFNEAFGSDGSEYQGIFTTILPAIRSVTQSYDNLDNTILVLGNYTFDRASKIQFVQDLEFVTIEPFRLYTYFQNNYNLDYKHKPITNPSNNKKFLCKFGKVNSRWNSYVLLNFLKDLDLLNSERGEWSLVYENSGSWHKIFCDTFNRIRDGNNQGFMPGISRFEHKDWIESHNIIDDFSFGEKCNTMGDFFYTGFPFDVKHHNDTQFTIVRETSIYNSFGIFPTEKTWIPISVKHPILLFGQPSLANYLEKAGYLAPDKFQFSKKFLSAKTYQQGLEIFKDSYDMFMNTSDSDMKMIADNNYQQFCKDVDKDIKILLNCGKFIDANSGKLMSALELLLRCHISNNAQSPSKPQNTNFDYSTINALYPDK